MDLRTTAYGRLPGQRVDIRTAGAERGAPVLVYFHGGGLEGGDRRDAAGVLDRLARTGVTVASPSYRLYPDARYPEFITDAAACVAWAVRELPERPLLVGGSSAGAYLAMMLCFDAHWLAGAGAAVTDVAGWVFDAGQSTTHFNVLRERGIDPRRVLVDEAAPLFHVGTQSQLAPTLIVLAADDVPGRREQTQVLLATLGAHGLDAQVRLEVMAGYRHSGYLDDAAPQGQARFADLVLELIDDVGRAA